MITIQDTIYMGTAAPASGGGGGSITVDQTYDALSTNAQSGTAVAEAVAMIESVANQNTNVGAISPLKIWNGTEQEWNTGGGSATWYNWKTEQINADTMLSGAPTFAFAVAASDSYAVAVCGNGFSVAPVDDRVPLFLQWKEVQFPTDFTGSAIAYGNDKFVCLSNNGKIAYATDPTNTSNWTVVSLPNGTYSGIRYINSRFVVFGSDIATSTDGVTWTAATMPSDVSSISDIAYGNSIYIVGGTDSSSHNVVAASSDLSTWNNAISFPTTFYRIAFGNGVFVVIDGGDPLASYYSTNGTTWTQNNLSLVSTDIVFGNGVFFVKSSGTSSDAATSIDGINWSNNDVGSNVMITSLATNGTTFVGVGGIMNEGSCICVVLGKSCYTSEASPTTASTVYSAPNVASALTIQYVDMGMEQIFLSDNNTYTYDATGNLTTNTSVGVAHPDWLCFINGVGVKIGTTSIVTVDQTYNASSTNAQSGVAVNSVVGNINTALESIIAQGD